MTPFSGSLRTNLVSMKAAIFSSSRAIYELVESLKSIFWAVMLAPAMNLVIDTRKNSICLKFAPVKIKNANVTMNIMDDFKFLLPCVSKFFKTIGFIFLSLGFKNMKRFRKAISRKGMTNCAKNVSPRMMSKSNAFMRYMKS